MESLTPSHVRVRSNTFDRGATAFQIGSTTVVLREVPEPLRKQLSPFVGAFEDGAYTTIPLEPDTDPAWHDLAWYVVRRFYYDGCQKHDTARRAANKGPAPYHCLDCGVRITSNEWCTNPNCSSATRYARIVGHLPLRVVAGTEAQQEEAHGKRRRARG